MAEPTVPCGCFEFEDARTRTVSGHLPPHLNRAHTGQEHTPETPTVHRGSNFATVLVHADGVIDQELFSQALPKMVEGACRVRGVVSLSDYSGERIAIEGIGPAVWLENTGPLDVIEAAPGTSIAITGDDVDAAEIQQLLESCVRPSPAHA
ncbi:GTP-binding protein [Rothia sp. LK2588]|uniref:GTP-binding protein n=1 Tax=Rothia sp. LK2588 TaxID=3114369 RepID=UPI0034CFB557